MLDENQTKNIWYHRVSTRSATGIGAILSLTLMRCLFQHKRTHVPVRFYAIVGQEGRDAMEESQRRVLASDIRLTAFIARPFLRHFDRIRIGMLKVDLRCRHYCNASTL